MRNIEEINYDTKRLYRTGKNDASVDLTALKAAAKDPAFVSVRHQIRRTLLKLKDPRKNGSRPEMLRDTKLINEFCVTRGYEPLVTDIMLSSIIYAY